MGRAVGGAGAGCAGAGLVGLLVSVAIVVWLGSQGLGGGDGDDDRDATRPTDPAGLLGVLDPPVVTIGDGGPVAPGPTVAVRATGVAPGVATVSVCAVATPLAAGAEIDPTSCGAVLATVEIGASGVLDAEVAVAADLELGDRRVDCRVDPCSVVVRPTGGAAPGAAALAIAS